MEERLVVSGSSWVVIDHWPKGEPPTNKGSLNPRDVGMAKWRPENPTPHTTLPLQFCGVTWTYDYVHGCNNPNHCKLCVCLVDFPLNFLEMKIYSDQMLNANTHKKRKTNKKNPNKYIYSKTCFAIICTFSIFIYFILAWIFIYNRCCALYYLCKQCVE